MNKRIFIALLLLFCLESLYSAVFLTEIHKDPIKTYVEVYNSSDSTISVTGWEIECGLNKHSFYGELKPNAVLVIRTENHFLTGDTLLLINSNSKILDRIVLKDVREGTNIEKVSIQRDTVVLFAEGVVLDSLSNFREGRESEGYLPTLFIQDRSTLYFSMNRASNELEGYYNAREISTLSTNKKDASQGNGIHLEISPNPVESVLTIKYLERNETNYVLKNMNGQILRCGLLRTGENYLDMSEYNSGIYLLMIGDGDDAQCKKVEKR